MKKGNLFIMNVVKALMDAFNCKYIIDELRKKMKRDSVTGEAAEIEYTKKLEIKESKKLRYPKKIQFI